MAASASISSGNSTALVRVDTSQARAHNLTTPILAITSQDVRASTIIPFLDGHDLAHYSVTCSDFHGDFVASLRKTGLISERIGREFLLPIPRPFPSLRRQYLQQTCQSFNFQNGVIDYRRGLRGLFALPNGHIVAKEGHNIKIYDPVTMQCIRTLEGHTQRITPLIFIPKGPHRETDLIVSSAGSKIKIWNPATGTCLRTLEGTTSPVTSLLLLKNGRFAAGSEDGNIRIWNPITGECERILEGPTSRITSLLLLSDGRIAAASGDAINIWNLNTGLEKTLALPPDQNDEWPRGPIGSLIPLAENQLVSAHSYDIQIWDLTTGEYREFNPELLADGAIIDSVVSLPGGLIGFTTSESKKMMALDPSTLAVRELPIPSHVSRDYYAHNYWMPTCDGLVRHVDGRDHSYRFNLTTLELLIRTGRRFARNEVEKADGDFALLPPSIQARVQARLPQNATAQQKADAILFVANQIYGARGRDSVLPPLDDQLRQLQQLLPQSAVVLQQRGAASAITASPGPAPAAPVRPPEAVEEKAISLPDQLRALQAAVESDDERAIQAHLSVFETTEEGRAILKALHTNMYKVCESARLIKQNDPRFGRKVFASKAEAVKLCKKVDGLTGLRLKAIQGTLRGLRK